MLLTHRSPSVTGLGSFGLEMQKKNANLVALSMLAAVDVSCVQQRSLLFHFWAHTESLAR